MSKRINISREGPGRFRVFLGPVSFSVTATPHKFAEGGVHLMKTKDIYIQPDTWEEVCLQVASLCRFDRTGVANGKV